jgi:hypothetical protein
MPGKEVQRLAMAWYRPEEWEKLRSVSIDGGMLEDTHEEWLAHAMKMLRKMERMGNEVMKVEITVDELVEWCRNKKLAIDGAARATLAVEKANARN